ncbi:autotransporter outer membrane beta-barrel domain-containing protein [Mesorhizobium sp. B1-1-9]|uniref:autotransporter outer membrane beta-barrel domain-containing protein n=1 Tax=Mesorhizobium sp. B1-1-9 TaxID=2589975 RepID=UPI001127077E|nr:autotransporter outer membrane beta-barrel domain-containing protein [Mesorhizobium sp. B1-1-9]TPN54388.1 autotransporter outer membrane beta-barrel domain-containing protein [Mesorhizobium sp. B1-1-9]
MVGRVHARGGVLTAARGRFLAGASLAVLVVAGVAPRQAIAGNYVANSDGSLRAAITAANADPDPNATITLTGSFTVSSTSLPTSTKPLTIDTQGFTLFGAPGSGVAISGAGAVRTLMGTFKGSDGGTSSAGLQIRTGAAVINMGLVQGGTGASGSGGSGVDFGGPGAVASLTNHGTIRGGPATSGNGGIGVYVRNGAGQIINTGTIESGGPGGGAIAANGATVSLDIVNSGVIRAGAGANAIGWISSVTPTTGVINLELQDGSQIFGNVVANATATTDRLRLNGTGFSVLDGSIGAAGQYRNFDIFEKTGSGTWALTADNTATTNWDIQQGTLQLGNGGTSGSIIGDVTNAGMLAFNRSDALTYGGVISGTGSVSQIGSGTTILTGANTYSGGTVINAGTLQVAADGNLGATSGNLSFGGGTLRTTASFSTARNVQLNGNGGFETAGGTQLDLTGQVTGAGTLVKHGLGTLNVINLSNSYTGGNIVNAGTLVGNAASIRGDIGNAGTVVFDQSMDASFAGDISGTGAMVKDGAGTLTLSGTSLLDWTIDQGGLVAAAERFGGDVSIGAGASFTFDQTANASYAGALSGAGNFVKDGLGTVVLTSDNSAFAGATLVNGGTLAAGAANAFSSASQFSVASGATLDLAGTSQTTAGLTNAGTVGIAGSLGSKLTVSGDYVGNGGNILIGTALGADNSQTNMMVIAGGTSGTGTLQVVNLGGGGAQTVEGIKIVDVGGVSNGSFSLKGNYTFEGDQAVVGGAYAYRLYQGGTSTPGDGDWYLRSALIDGGGPGTPLYQAGAPLYEAYAGALQTFNQLGTLQQRLGNRSWTVEAQGADGVSDDVRAEAGIGLWGRIEGTSGSYDPENSTTGTTYDTSTWKLQTGADMLLSDTAAGQLIGGVAFQYGTVSADVSSLFGGGSIDSTGTGVSGSLTWYGAEGFYLDSQAQVIWYDSDLDSATAGQRLVDGNNGVGYALGVEAGKRIMLDPSWSLTPQAQLAWSSVDLDAFTDAFGARVAPGSNDSLLGRLGLSLDHQSQWQDRSGRTGHTNVYTIANLYYDFEDGSSVDLAGSTLSSRNERLWGGLGIGGTINWADDKFSVFGEAVARTGLENFGDSHALTGSLGLRVKW